MENKPHIEVRSMNKSFGKNHVLRDFSLSLGAEENLAILGKSGSGKSVLIKCIIRLIEPDSGLITVLGKDISSLLIKFFIYFSSTYSTTLECLYWTFKSIYNTTTNSFTKSYSTFEIFF
jgi:ABC-type multidrug transport system ATPase subunit